MNWNEEKNAPLVLGIVPRDPRAAGELMPCYTEKLCAVSSYAERSLSAAFVSPELGARFDKIAVEERSHFCALRDLIEALGGNSVVSIPRSDGQGSTPPEIPDARRISQMLCEAIADEKRMIDRLESTMGRCENRVIRSVLARLIADDQRHLCALGLLFNR